MVLQKTALVTGGNKGIGAEVARQLAEAGMRVIIGARDRHRGEDAAHLLAERGLDVRAVVLDVRDESTIAAAAQTIEDEEGALDLLVNNAGIASWQDGPPSSSSLSAVRELLETNFVGALAVTQAMLPLLREAPAARIVNISSSLGSLTSINVPGSPYPGVAGVAYGPSKSALNAITVAFAHELAATKIKVNAACPGYTATDMTGHHGPRTVEQAAREPVRLALLADDGPTGGFTNEDGPIPW